MKKRLLCLLFICFSFILCGCGEEMTPRDATRDYLEKYVTLDSGIIKQMDEFLDEQELNEEQKNLYRDVLKKQYTSMTYTIKNEKVEEDIAYVNVNIKVLDLYSTQKDSLDYYENHKEEFNDDEGVYDKAKFLMYKLEQMKVTTKTINHDITLKVVKNDGDWEVSQLSNEDLEKIHGIYNYEG